MAKLIASLCRCGQAFVVDQLLDSLLQQLPLVLVPLCLGLEYSGSGHLPFEDWEVVQQTFEG